MTEEYENNKEELNVAINKIDAQLAGNPSNHARYHELLKVILSWTNYTMLSSRHFNNMQELSNLDKSFIVRISTQLGIQMGGKAVTELRERVYEELSLVEGDNKKFCSVLLNKVTISAKNEDEYDGWMLTAMAINLYVELP